MIRYSFIFIIALAFNISISKYNKYIQNMVMNHKLIHLAWKQFSYS